MWLKFLQLWVCGCEGREVGDGEGNPDVQVATQPHPFWKWAAWEAGKAGFLVLGAILYEN